MNPARPHRSSHRYRYPTILVHGINDNGLWHGVESVLAPFFECVRVRYREFHLRGEIKLVLWLWAIPLVVLLGLAGATPRAATAVAIAGVLIGFAHLLLGRLVAGPVAAVLLFPFVIFFSFDPAVRSCFGPV